MTQDRYISGDRGIALFLGSAVFQERPSMESSFYDRATEIRKRLATLGDSL